VQIVTTGKHAYRSLHSTMQNNKVGAFHKRFINLKGTKRYNFVVNNYD